MKRLHKVAARVAAFLPGWRFNQLRELGPTAELIGPDGMTLFFWGGREPGKIRISGRFPSWGRWGRADGYRCLTRLKNHIGVSINRAPAAIAADIQRRLMPQYVTYYALAKQEKAETIARMENMRHQAQAMCHVYQGAKVDPAWKPDAYAHQINVLTDYIHLDKGGGPSRIKISLTYGVSMELNNLPAESAIKVLALLQSEKERLTNLQDEIK